MVVILQIMHMNEIGKPDNIQVRWTLAIRSSYKTRLTKTGIEPEFFKIIWNGEDG